MARWHKTSFVQWAQNCGLEVQVEINRMVKVRADKDNLRSRDQRECMLLLGGKK